MADSGFYIPLEDWSQYDTLDGMLAKFQWVYNKVSDYSSSFSAVSGLIESIRNMEVNDRVMTELMYFFKQRDDLVLLAKNTKVDEPYAIRIYKKYTGYTSFNDMYQSIIPDDELYTVPYTEVKAILTPLSAPHMLRIEYEYIIPFRNCPTEEGLTDNTALALANLVDWFNSQFGLDDLVKGEPYSLPPANAELASQAIIGGLTSFGVNQVVPLGTFAMQVLEQYQTQKLNYTADISLQLIIAMFKILVAGLWPKGDLSELTAAFSPLDTGSEYRAKINDHWLNQSLVRALNHKAGEEDLDDSSENKVVAEKTDLYGVLYGNFKKLFPYKTVSDDIFYLTEDFKIAPWPCQAYYVS